MRAIGAERSTPAAAREGELGTRTTSNPEAKGVRTTCRTSLSRARSATVLAGTKMRTTSMRNGRTTQLSVRCTISPLWDIAVSVSSISTAEADAPHEGS